MGVQSMKRESSEYEWRRRNPCVAALLLALVAYSAAGTALAQSTKGKKAKPGTKPQAAKPQTAKPERNP